MDTSEQYRKMCEKAVEIQSGWVPKDGDFHFDPHHHMIETYFYATSSARCIFLPRQDQLQKMVWKAVTFTGKMTGCIEYYWNSRPHTFTINTAEQLWLAFVMKEKYGKVWDSQKENWVKEER